jgi:hypothetical protein
MGFLAPPIAVVFLGGILWPRANAPGAAAALAYGGAIGAARLVGEIALGPPGVEASGPLFFHVNFLHFTLFLGATSAMVLVAVSLLTAPPPHRCIHGLTFAHRHSAVAEQAMATLEAAQVLPHIRGASTPEAGFDEPDSCRRGDANSQAELSDGDFGRAGSPTLLFDDRGVELEDGGGAVWGEGGRDRTSVVASAVLVLALFAAVLYFR